MKRTLSIFLIVLFLFSVTGCQVNRKAEYPATSMLTVVETKVYTEFQKKYDSDVNTMEVKEGQEYLGYGLWKDGNYLHNTTTYIDDGSVFDGFFSLTNSLGETKKFTLVVFDNYQLKIWLFQAAEVLKIDVLWLWIMRKHTRIPSNHG